MLATASPVTRLVNLGLAPQKIVGPPRDQTDRDLPRTNGVGVALAYGAYCIVPFAPRKSRLVTGPVMAIDVIDLLIARVEDCGDNH